MPRSGMRGSHYFAQPSEPRSRSSAAARRRVAGQSARGPRAVIKSAALRQRGCFPPPATRPWAAGPRGLQPRGTACPGVAEPDNTRLQASFTRSARVLRRYSAASLCLCSLLISRGRTKRACLLASRAAHLRSGAAAELLGGRRRGEKGITYYSFSRKMRDKRAKIRTKTGTKITQSYILY